MKSCQDGSCGSCDWCVSHRNKPVTESGIELLDVPQMSRYLNMFAKLCYQRAVAAGWHNDATGKQTPRDIGTLVALTHTEVSEAFEGYRRGLQDDHLPHRKMVEVEIADAMIRLGNLIGELVYQGVLDKVDIGGAVLEKLEYNLHRADHKLEARQAEGGKKL